MVTASKDLFLRLIFLLGGLGLCFVQAQPTYSYRLVDDRCDLKQCLFIEQASEVGGCLNSVMGTVQVTGFYGSIVREGSTAETIVPQKTLVCPALTVTNAPQFFQKAFKKLVKGQNTVNHLDEEGRLVLAINFGDLKASEIRHIKHADRQHPVRLTLLKPIGLEGEISRCGSLFEVLRVENAER